MVYASDLQTLSPHKVIIKYADDILLLVANIAQLISPRNNIMIISVLGPSETLIPAKQKKLFFIGLVL